MLLATWVWMRPCLGVQLTCECCTLVHWVLLLVMLVLICTRLILLASMFT